MNLTLKVISHQNETLGDAASKSFDEQGGSFGRSADNAWVVPDDSRVVSGQHGMIFFEDGNFHLMDISKNGIYLNDNSSPLGKGQVTVLQVGDVLAFGDYQVQVCAEQDGSNTPPLVPDQELPVPPAVKDVSDAAEDGTDSGGTSEQSDYIQHELEEHREPAYDPLAGLNPGNAENYSGGSNLQKVDRDVTPGLSHDGSSPQSSAFSPRAVKVDTDLEPEAGNEGSREIIPEDWDMTGFNDNVEGPGSQAPESGDRPAVTPVVEGGNKQIPPEPVPVAAAAPQSPGSRGLDAYQAFIKGAGLDQLGQAMGNDPVRDMEKAGALFRELVHGLMVLLQSRAELKNQFRMSATTIKPTENNPLKFSPHVDEALKTLFADDRLGFLQGDEAVKEAIGDIRNHQIAMIVAMHAGVKGLLDKFQPPRFENEEAGGLVKSALLSANKNSRAWENYRNYYELVVVESGDAFQILCAEEFNDAYDEQLRRLESSNGSGK